MVEDMRESMIERCRKRYKESETSQYYMWNKTLHVEIEVVNSVDSSMFVHYVQQETHQEMIANVNFL